MNPSSTNSIWWAWTLSAAALGATMALASAMHCAAMCGPLAASACTKKSLPAYLVGRLFSYGALGVLVGSLGRTWIGRYQWVRRDLALQLLSFLILALCIHWMSKQVQVHVAKRSLLQSARSLLRKSRNMGTEPRTAFAPFLLGFASAALPCSVLWMSLFGAAATGSGIRGGIYMLSFALVSAAPLSLFSSLAVPLQEHPRLARVFPYFGLVCSLTLFFVGQSQGHCAP